MTYWQRGQRKKKRRRTVVVWTWKAVRAAAVRLVVREWLRSAGRRRGVRAVQARVVGTEGAAAGCERTEGREGLRLKDQRQKQRKEEEAEHRQVREILAVAAVVEAEEEQSASTEQRKAAERGKEMDQRSKETEVKEKLDDREVAASGWDMAAGVAGTCDESAVAAGGVAGVVESSVDCSVVAWNYAAVEATAVPVVVAGAVRCVRCLAARVRPKCAWTV